MPDTVMFFAAGFGTRMGALTQDRPKPLIPVAGKPLLDHALDLAKDAHIPRLVVNAHYHADQIKAAAAVRGLEVSHETPQVLDTGGGLKAAMPLLNRQEVFTMNTDAVWRGPNPFEVLQAAWQPEKMDALLLCVPLAQAVGRKGVGDFVLDGEGRLSRGPEVVYTGAQILKTDLVREVADDVFSLNLIWTALEQTGRLFGAQYRGQWCDVGHPEGIALAESMVAGDV